MQPNPTRKKNDGEETCTFSIDEEKYMVICNMKKMIFKSNCDVCELVIIINDHYDQNCRIHFIIHICHNVC